jgi:serine/threonine protein kinase
MNENLIRVYTKQILEGIEYLHVNNVVHRDIKAANILVDSKGTCKLADFGSSKKFYGSFNQFKSLCGTPYWMPPEVIRQSGHNRHADIWSLGCTVYEMLMGHPPWTDKKDIIQVFLCIATATEPPLIPANALVSPELKSFLEACF